MNYQGLIFQAFSGVGYHPESRINKNTLHEILNQLYGRKYLDDIIDELWEQVQVNKYGQTLVEQIVKAITKGQIILVSKLKDIENRLISLKVYLSKGTNRQNIEKIQNINFDIIQLNNQKEEFEQDLQLLTKPFNIYINYKNDYRMIDQNTLNIEQIYGDEIYSQELKYLAWLTFILFFNQVTISYSKFGYVNMMGCLTLLSIFLLNFFNSRYIVYTMGIIILCIGYDFIWLMVWGSKYWSIVLTVFAQSSLFQKTTLFITIFNVILKLLIIIILFKFIDVKDKTVYKVQPFRKFKLSLISKQNFITQFQQKLQQTYL